MSIYTWFVRPDPALKSAGVCAVTDPCRPHDETAPARAGLLDTFRHGGSIPAETGTADSDSDGGAGLSGGTPPRRPVGPRHGEVPDRRSGQRRRDADRKIQPFRLRRACDGGLATVEIPTGPPRRTTYRNRGFDPGGVRGGKLRRRISWRRFSRRRLCRWGIVTVTRVRRAGRVSDVRCILLRCPVRPSPSRPIPAVRLRPARLRTRPAATLPACASRSGRTRMEPAG